MFLLERWRRGRNRNGQAHVARTANAAANVHGGCMRRCESWIAHRQRRLPCAATLANARGRNRDRSGLRRIDDWKLDRRLS
ncbi:hypothetical protein LG3211_5120 [Lysobacter gummosus]|nr:hypothetical protein LG3211_5120 [Lysobacter gummosus]